MPLIYTNIDAIARRLRGRLKIPNATLSPMTAPGHMTQQAVDPELIKDIGLQVEDRLNMILRQIYKLPLRNKHPILAGIVERLVVADIMLTHYQDTQIPEMGGDAKFGGIMYSKAQQDIAMLTAGHNIAIPGVPMPPSIPGVATPQPIFLDGEETVESPPDTLTKNYTFTGRGSRREMSDYARNEWGIIWGDGRAKDADKIWS